jgi:prepilin-type N-terminal cleavage/methylation domain-containing protein/prepilin-type processing-associated H-X9-DG protein
MNSSRSKSQETICLTCRASSGFSLIEVLVVVLIIAVLAAFSMMAIANMRRSASSAVCVMKMSQIGSALIIYVQERNGRLPTSPSYGTLFVGQGPWYNRDDRRLQRHLGEYLGARESSTWSTQASLMTFDSSFAWPALLADGKPGASSVLLNTSVKYRGGDTESTISPWSGTKPDGGTYQGRMLDNILDPGKAKVFFEVDQKNTTAGWKNLQPPEPIHGKYRNCLYFDWHVDRIPATP